MRGTTCCEQDASLAIIRRALRFERIVANADVATTTYSYDANGNLLQAGGWSYVWDYLNRMLASGFNNSTTTYAYDPAGNRVLQTSTTSATYYPNKYYSFTSTKSGANTYATSTNYVFNGDTLLATIDQPLYNGAATGSPITRYIHPDHLGSTNAVTDQNGNLVQLLDYYPYGATRISTSTYPTNEKRQYIGQFSDAQTNLSYFNARYYDSTRGQFVSEDPVFWGKQNLKNPQTLNAYLYANDNPILLKDPSGLDPFGDFFYGFVPPSQQSSFNQMAMNLSNNSSMWNFAINHPYSTAAFTSIGSIPAVASGGGVADALFYATYPGVSAGYAAQYAFAAFVSGILMVDSTLSVPGFVRDMTQFSTRNPASIIPAAWSLGTGPVLTAVGGYPGALFDTYQFSSIVVNTIGSAASYLYSNSIQARTQAANSFNAKIGSASAATAGSGGGGGGGGSSMPASNSLWVTPSGAVVTWSGALVSTPPPSK